MTSGRTSSPKHDMRVVHAVTSSGAGPGHRRARSACVSQSVFHSGIVSGSVTRGGGFAGGVLEHAATTRLTRRKTRAVDTSAPYPSGRMRARSSSTLAPMPLP